MLTVFPGVGVLSCKCPITGRNYSDTAFCESDFVQKRKFSWNGAISCRFNWSIFLNLWTGVNSWKCSLLMLRFYDIKFCNNMVDTIFWNNLVMVNFMHARGGVLSHWWIISSLECHYLYTCCSSVHQSLLYRVIHKSLQDFRTRLRNNQDRHSRKEHINR